MKKLVALMLSLCLLIGCVPAYAEAFFPTTMEDVHAPAQPKVPAYTLEIVGDHYELTVEGLSSEQWASGEISGKNADDLWSFISFSWNNDYTKLESSSLLDDEYTMQQLFIEYGDLNSNAYASFGIDLENNKQNQTTLMIPDEQGNERLYSWYEPMNEFNYYSTIDDRTISITYDLTSGEIEYYMLSTSDDIALSYNKYGALTSVEFFDEEHFAVYYWDQYKQQWVSDDGIPSDEFAPFVEENYPAPYAAPFILRRPAQNLQDADLAAGLLYPMDDGTAYYVSDTVTGYYDQNGALISYFYNNIDGTKYVEYSADDQLMTASIFFRDGSAYWYDEAIGWFYLDADGNETPLATPPEGLMDDMQPLLAETAKKKVEYTWYDHNTVGVAGLSLRDMGFTDKWYNVVPVDLTQDGVQTFSLVASNMYHIGKATVTVLDGQVTVDYQLHPGQGHLKDECVQWFTSLEDITADFLNDPVSELAFGQAVSIADDLDGAEVALLFICNHVTYRQPYHGDDGYLSRYWPNRQRWIDYRAELTELMERMAK